MKKIVPLGVAVAFSILATTAWFKTRPPQIVPLKTPTAAQFQKTFPRDTRQILEQSQTLTLYSVSVTSPNPYGQAQFQGLTILGKVEIKAAGQKARLLASFYDGVARARGTALCFNPHHGLRAIYNGKTVDFLICFGCKQMQIFDGHSDDSPYYEIDNSPQTFFTQLLTQEGITVKQGVE